MEIAKIAKNELRAETVSGTVVACMTYKLDRPENVCREVHESTCSRLFGRNHNARRKKAKVGNNIHKCLMCILYTFHSGRSHFIFICYLTGTKIRNVAALENDEPMVFAGKTTFYHIA